MTQSQRYLRNVKRTLCKVGALEIKISRDGFIKQRVLEYTVKIQIAVDKILRCIKATIANLSNRFKRKLVLYFV